MPVDEQRLIGWCRTLLGADATAPRLALGDYLARIPRLDRLDHLPAGTHVLVRGDVDAKPGAQVGQGDVRLRSMLETLEHGRRRGWVQIVCGHIGRKPEGSLKAVAARLAELLGQPVPLVAGWLDAERCEVPDPIAAALATAQPGSVLLLENTRQYDIERVLWKAQPDDLPQLVPRLARLANSLAERVARVYVNEALSAGSLDSSTTVVPAAMDHAVLGAYVGREFDGPMQQCLQARLVVFSGLKADKLDDMQAMLDRGTVRRMICAGSLAMALLKGAARVDGRKFSAGVAEGAAHADKPYYLPEERIEQAAGMIRAGRAAGVEFVLPVDFVLQDGQVASELAAGDQQFDVGPATQAHFAAAIDRVIAEHRAAVVAGQPAQVAFHNGVFGMFEDPRFESGTRHFIGQLRRMTDAGLGVYVGGGEGGTALERYGQADWVTHCFTAGGTVLNALGNSPVPYLQALAMAAGS